MSDVSGNRPPTQDFNRKIVTHPRGWGKVRMAVISYPGDRGDLAACNCGWSARHERPKVLEDKIDTHLAKRHGGTAIRI